MNLPAWFRLHGAACAECGYPAHWIDVRRRVHHAIPKPPCQLPQPLNVLKEPTR